MKKVLVTLLIISTVFTACKDETTPTPTSYPNLDGMYKVWVSSLSSENVFDMEIQKISNSYFRTEALLTPSFTDIFISSGEWNTDSITGRTFQSLLLENNEGIPRGKLFADNNWVEFYYGTTLMKARPWTDKDTLIQEDTTGSGTTGPSLSDFNEVDFQYIQSSSRKFHVKRTGIDELTKFEEGKVIPTSETFTQLNKISPSMWVGIYSGWDQNLGSVLLEITPEGDLVITVDHINGKTYIATETK